MAPRLARGNPGWLVAVGLALLVSGCATAAKREDIRLVWPPPPLKPRVEFVRSIVSDENLGRDTTFTQKLAIFLGGEKPTTNRIVEPMGLAVSDDGQRLYVSDFAQLAVFVFDFGQKKFTKIGSEEKLARPVGIALDGEERLYVVEQENKGVAVFDRSGKRVKFITDPSIERPTGVAVDRTRGRLYVSDTAHTKSTEHSVKIFDLDGHLVGKLGGEKGEAPGRFLFPTYVSVDPQGHVYVTDTLNSRVQMFDADGKYVKSFGQRGNSWGMFDKPKGLALDSFGNLYVADSGWSNVQIFNPKGQILLFFGGRGPIPGMLKNPTAVTIDPQNHIYVADYLNHRVDEYRLVNTTAGDSFLAPANQGKGGDGERNRAVEPVSKKKD